MSQGSLVLATNNRAKAAEMRFVLEPLLPGFTLLSLDDFEPQPEPEEVGGTYAENAEIKALACASHTGLPSLADDAGLEIDALGGAPGVHSHRFGGAETPFERKIAMVLEQMLAVPVAERGARFRCCVAYTAPGKVPQTTEATCEGVIAEQPRGLNGFGYDPIFLLPELGRTMAELTAAEKRAVSHRGKVLRAFAAALVGQPAL